ncbi:N-acyl amino acid synthase FeeM domain-containing protein [Thiobacillus sp.]
MTLSLSKLIGRGRSIADDFDRTIISFESPYRLKDLSPLSEGGADTQEERLSEKLFKLRFAQQDETFNHASVLVQKRYAWRGFPKAQLKKYPNRITILSFHEEKIVGTVTVGYDTEEGMLVDEIYKPEIDALRAQGRRVGELSKLAIDENIGSKQLFASLIHVAYLYGVIHECTDAIIEIVPRHKAFYERMLGFKQIGEEKMNNRVNFPVLLMHLELDYMRQKIEALGGKGKTAKDRSLYPYFFSAHDQEGILGRLLREET